MKPPIRTKYSWIFSAFAVLIFVLIISPFGEGEKIIQQSTDTLLFDPLLNSDSVNAINELPSFSYVVFSYIGQILWGVIKIILWACLAVIALIFWPFMKANYKAKELAAIAGGDKKEASKYRDLGSGLWVFPLAAIVAMFAEVPKMFLEPDRVSDRKLIFEAYQSDDFLKSEESDVLDKWEINTNPIFANTGEDQKKVELSSVKLVASGMNIESNSIAYAELKCRWADPEGKTLFELISPLFVDRSVPRDLMIPPGLRGRLDGRLSVPSQFRSSVEFDKSQCSVFRAYTRKFIPPKDNTLVIAIAGDSRVSVTNTSTQTVRIHSLDLSCIVSSAEDLPDWEDFSVYFGESPVNLSGGQSLDISEYSGQGRDWTPKYCNATLGD